MKHLKFVVKNEYNNYLYKILEGINSKGKIWKVLEDDIFYRDGVLFDNECYNNNDFFNIIKKDDYYIVFCNIQMYGDFSAASLIEKPSDFIKNQCELVLLITDNIFVEVFVKSEENFNRILLNLEKNGVKEIEINDNWNRVTMSAYGD